MPSRAHPPADPPPRRAAGAAVTGLSRRALLGLGVGVALDARAAGVDPSMRLRTIPSSGEALPVIGFGTSRVFDVAPNEAAALAPLADVLRVLLDAGGQLIDTSPMYGRAEAVSGAVAARIGAVDRLFWATKVWTDGREAGRAQLERSLEHFGVATLDLVQIHNLRDWRTHLETLREWQAAGRVRYIGLTTSRASAYADMERVIEAARPDFVQLNYSIGEREAEARLLPLCAERGIATLVNRPFMRGALFRAVAARPLPAFALALGARSWAQYFLKFVLGHPAVTCAIPATSSARHAADNVQAGFGPLPDAAARERLAAFVAAA